MALMDATRAAVYLTEQHVPSIGPELGKHLVLVATKVDAALAGMPAGPARRTCERYRDALNAVTEMACYQQIAVLAKLKDLVEGVR